MSLNESFGFVRARIKPKRSFRMNNRSSFGLFNKFKSYNPYKYVSCKKCTTTLGPQVSMVLEKN